MQPLFSIFSIEDFADCLTSLCDTPGRDVTDRSAHPGGAGCNWFRPIFIQRQIIDADSYLLQDPLIERFIDVDPSRCARYQRSVVRRYNSLLRRRLATICDSLLNRFAMRGPSVHTPVEVIWRKSGGINEQVSPCSPTHQRNYWLTLLKSALVSI